jgi:hypothetical protein
LFKFSSEKQAIEQTFGIQLKTYHGKHKTLPDINRSLVDPGKWTPEEKADAIAGEGAYIFLPDWRDPFPVVYGKLNQEVEYQKGALIEQWTILY